MSSRIGSVLRNSNMARRAAVVLVVLLSIGAAEVPFLSGRVNDTASMLSRKTLVDLEELLRRHEDSTSNQVVVLTIPTLGEDVLEDYSMKVVETWKLGQAQTDNGVLLLIVRDDRLVRIEVGAGLEGNLTDAMCGRIIRREIVPRFKEGDYDAGIRAGVDAILAGIAGAYSADEPDDADDIMERIAGGVVFLAVAGLFSLLALASKGASSWGLFFFLIPFWLVFPIGLFGFRAGMTVFVTYIVGFLLARRWFSGSTLGKRLVSNWALGRGLGALSSGGWSSRGGTFSGGGFSGGGGSFGGGGASGRW